MYLLALIIKETITPQPGTLIDSPPETFTQQLKTPGTVTILQDAEHIPKLTYMLRGYDMF